MQIMQFPRERGTPVSRLPSDRNIFRAEHDTEALVIICLFVGCRAMEAGWLCGMNGENNFRVTEADIPFELSLSTFGRSRFAPGRYYYQFSLAFVSDHIQRCHYEQRNLCRRLSANYFR